MSSALELAVADFLAHKRALGRKYLSEEATLRLLVAFARTKDARELHDLTPVLIDDFVASRVRERARSFNAMVGILGCFFDWAIGQQRLAASPLAVAKRRETDTRLPFLFDRSQALQLLQAAAALPDNSRARGRGATYHAIFALCYGLGLRAGEACGLSTDDVDNERQLLVVRGGKFGKSRLVPHGPRVAELLAIYMERHVHRSEGPLFSFDAWRSIHPCTASQTFHPLMGELAFPVPDGVSPPVLHSLRHSFAVACLLRWYREGVDPQTRLYRLSTFMGHVAPASTAVYLTITPQLLEQANRRFEAYAEPSWTEASR
jgi:integrase